MKAKLKASAQPDDRVHMTAALALARRGLGRVWPNPAVGCVLVKEGHVIGRGWTQPGGRPHAETEALARAGNAARGATAYVSLEPCAHHGKTPPCSEALRASGIARCLVACEDPDPRVAGQGISQLRDAGVDVEVGLCAEEARRLNAGFLLRLSAGRPLVTLKLAASLDGGIATSAGESRWITSERARRHAHLLRAESDAVMVGSGTALADDPQLTVRLDGLGRYCPIRIAVDGRLRLPLTSAMVVTAKDRATWLLTRKDSDRTRREAFQDLGVEVITLPTHQGELLDLAAGLQALGERGLTRVLVEGGGVLASALLQAGLVDRLALYRAPMLLGSDARPAVAPLGLTRLDAAPAFELLESVDLDPDRFELYVRR